MISSVARGSTGMPAMREHDETPGTGQGMVYWLISPEDQRRTLGTDVSPVYAEHPAGSGHALPIAASAFSQVPPLSTSPHLTSPAMCACFQYWEHTRVAIVF